MVNVESPMPGRPAMPAPMRDSGEPSELTTDGLKVCKTQTVMLGDWGARLPCGTLNPTTNELDRDLALRLPWTLKTEKRLGKLQAENKNQNVGRYLTAVVGAIYDRVGGIQLVDLEGAANQVKLRQIGALGSLLMGDMLYAWLWARHQAVNSKVPMLAPCNRCGATPEGFKADLDTVEVRVVESMEDAEWDYQLENPLTIRHKLVDRLRFGPPTWRSIEMTPTASSFDQGNVKAAMILASLRYAHGLEGQALAEHEIDDMTKLDLENITTEIDKNHIGPQMVLELECPSCRMTVRRMLDWMHPSFFGTSSR